MKCVRVALAASLVLWAFCAVPAVAAVAADAAASAPMPVADFARRPKYSSVRFSPDGTKFSALQELDGRANLTIGDLRANKLTRVTSFSSYDVGAYDWISNNRLVLSLYDSKKGLAESRGGGLYAVNADGSQSKELASMTSRPMRFVRRIAGSEDEIVAIGYERDSQTADVYRVNSRTGRKTLLTEDNPGKVQKWILDKDNIPRAAIAENGRENTETFWLRDRADSPWRKISTATGNERRMRPAAFDSDGSLLVYSNLESDTFKLYAFDSANAKTTTLLLGNPVADLDEAVVIAPPSTGYHIVGIQYESDKPEVAWFDAKYAGIQALMDASLPKGNINRFTLLDDGRVAVSSASERDPGTFYLYDPAKKQLEEILQPFDWIDPQRMSPTRVVRYKARDGLEIPAYLTTPVGRPVAKLPLIAWIHGGPFGIRDDYRYDPDVQFIASRGYAVLQPNYRGSGGYGLRHFTAGVKQWGQAMQDDITDGIRYLVAQGIVDPDRVCIGGGSYGGYATLMGLVKDPDLYKCGIAEAAVSDLFWLGELGYSDFNQIDSAASETFQHSMVGNPKTDEAMMKTYSPRLHADRIKAPLMIVHAVRDQRVPFQHAEGMRDAMRAAGKDVEWVVYPDEAHGFAKFENRVDRYNKIEAFLKKNIGQ